MESDCSCILFKKPSCEMFVMEPRLSGPISAMCKDSWPLLTMLGTLLPPPITKSPPLSWSFFSQQLQAACNDVHTLCGGYFISALLWSLLWHHCNVLGGINILKIINESGRSKEWAMIHFVQMETVKLGLEKIDVPPVSFHGKIVPNVNRKLYLWKPFL